jgi:hypothetical protein
MKIAQVALDILATRASRNHGETTLNVNAPAVILERETNYI